MDDVTSAIREAHTLLADVRSFKDMSVSDEIAINRLYYACYHAVSAVLYDRGYNPKTHSGVKSLLGKELVLSGAVSRADGEFFGAMHDRRERADYEYHPVSADVDALLNRTEEFVANMANLIDAEADTTETE